MENVGNIDEERGDKAIVDTLLSDTFNSILRIEERSLKNRLTEGLSIAELHTIVAVGLAAYVPMSGLQSLILSRIVDLSMP